MTVENAVKNNGGKNMSYNEFLPSYSIGDDCYKEIPYVTRRYGKTAVVIGGKTAMEKSSRHTAAISENALQTIISVVTESHMAVTESHLRRCRK